MFMYVNVCIGHDRDVHVHGCAILHACSTSQMSTHTPACLCVTAHMYTCRVRESHQFTEVKIIFPHLPRESAHGPRELPVSGV